MDDSVEPVHNTAPQDPVSSHGEAGPGGHAQHAPIAGTVVAVHRKTARHEGHHLLDASVGAQEHTEIVVRVESGSLEHLEGKRVTLHVAPD